MHDTRKDVHDVFNRVMVCDEVMVHNKNAYDLVASKEGLKSI